MRIVALFCVLSAVVVTPAWSDLFRVDRSLHYRAHYFDTAGTRHELEVWRDKDRRLRRDSDGILSIFVDHRGDGDDAFEVVDRRRQVRMQVGKNQLHRLGLFSDWASLASGISEPRRAYSLKRVRGAAIKGCVWYQLDRQRLCISRKLGVPLRIEDLEHRPQFEIDQHDSEPIAEAIFDRDPSQVVLSVDRDLAEAD